MSWSAGSDLIPINRTTLNELYGLNLLSDEEAEAFYQSRSEHVDVVRSSEDVVVSRVRSDSDKPDDIERTLRPQPLERRGSGSFLPKQERARRRGAQLGRCRGQQGPI